MKDFDTDGYEPVRRYKGRKKMSSAPIGLTVLLAMMVVVGVVIFVMSLTGTGLFKNSGQTPLPPAVSDTEGNGTEPGEETEPETEPETEGETDPLPPEEVAYQFSEKNAKDSGKGDLVLIDKDHIYTFPSGITLETLYGNMSSSYQISLSSLKLKPEVIDALNAMMDEFAAQTEFRKAIVTGAYRDFDTQKNLYEKNPSGAAAPGCSDYHSGATFMLEGYVDDSGGIFSLTNRQEGVWLKQNAARYGFIFRYPSDKRSITGYSIPWQMRYVGIPHATYMYENGLCLEEYLNLLAEKYLYAGEHLTVDAGDGMRYEIFYVTGAEEGSVKIPLPTNREYTLSGDNRGGFIVTVTLGPTPVPQETGAA